MQKSSNILVTGSSGFLGSYIVNYLQAIARVFTLNRSSGDYICNLGNQVPEFSHKFDMVIHCAGQAHKFNKDLYFKTNVIGTENLLNGLESSPPKKFVFISSVSVYGNVHGELLNEKTETLATDPYGLSKINAEKMIISWCLKHNLKLTILRLPLVFGYDAPGNLGAMIKGIKNGYYFNIDGGKSQKSIVLAEDVAKFILPASEAGGIFNLSDGYNPTIFELSNSLSKNRRLKMVFNMPYFFAYYLAKIGDLLGTNFPINSSKLKKITSNLTFNDSLAREVFHWSPQSVLEYINLGSRNKILQQK